MIIQNAENLEDFYYSIWDGNDIERTINIIDVHTFEKLVGIIKRRRDQTPLKLELSKNGFSIDIPAEMISAASDLLKLKLFDE